MTLSPSCSAIASGLRVVTVTVSLLVVLLYAIFVYNPFVSYLPLNYPIWGCALVSWDLSDVSTNRTLKIKSIINCINFFIQNIIECLLQASQVPGSRDMMVNKNNIVHVFLSLQFGGGDRQINK